MHLARFVFALAGLCFVFQAMKVEASQVPANRSFANAMVVYAEPIVIDANCGPIYLDVLSYNYGFNFFVVDVWGAAYGSLGLTADDYIVYEPDFNFIGQDSFSYAISDDFGNIIYDSVGIIVQPPAPLTFDNVLFTVENNAGETALDVLGSAAGVGFSVIDVSPAIYGWSTLDRVGTVIYLPPAGFVGVDTFTFAATDLFGTVSTGVVLIQVVPSIGPVTVTVNASASPTDILPGDFVSFAATGSSSNGGALNYRWNFGDGTFGSGQFVSHSYGAPGTYWATVTATDSTNAMASSYVIIFVDFPEPIISFTTSDFVGYVDTPLIFNAYANFDFVADESYFWNFGDGTDGYDEVVSKVYSEPGEYTVTLALRNSTANAGAANRLSRTVHVFPAGSKVTASKIAYKVKAAVGDSTVGDMKLSLSVANGGGSVTSGAKVAFVFEGKRFDGTLNAKLADRTNPNVKWTVKSNSRTGIQTLAIKIKKADLGAGLKRLVNNSTIGTTVSNAVPIHIEIGSQIYEISVPSTFALSTDGKTITGNGNGP